MRVSEVPKAGTKSKTERSFEFSARERTKMQAVLDELGSSLTTDEMIRFLIEAIRSREYVKF